MPHAITRRILLVEDNKSLAGEVKKILESEGFEIKWAESLYEGRKLYDKFQMDLVLLDIHLPDGLGFQLCREIREDDSGLPILFFTDNTNEDTVVKGLSFATTDFMRKPFTRGELVLRVRKLLKQNPGPLVVGELQISPDQREVRWKGNLLRLSPREFDLLTLLTSNLGRLVTRDKMASSVEEGDVSERTFNSYLSRLKTKLAAASVEGIKISAVYGEGYRLEKE